MKTYQDLLELKSTADIPPFLERAIEEYKSTDEFQNALLGRDYQHQMNRTVSQIQRMLYTASGQAIPDTYSPNYRSASAFYRNNNIQIAQYLLANGVAFVDDATKVLLGGAEFDNKLAYAGRTALAEGRVYGYYNGQNVTILRADQIVPLYDEKSGAIGAAIRHWRFAPNKPLYVTLYLVEGYIEFVKEKSEPLMPVDGFSLDAPRPYKTITASYKTGESEVVGYANFPGLPIVPFYANYDRLAEIVGKRAHLDMYDLIESGFANSVEEAAFLYFKLTNASGMDDVDIAEFKQRLRTQHVAKTNSNTDVEPVQLEVPTEARETLLTRLEKDIYNDAMVVNLHEIAGGDVRNAAIQAAFAQMNSRVDEFEYCVIDFITALLRLAGVEDTPSFTRSAITNEPEYTDMILSAAEYLDEETVLKKLPFLTSDDVTRIMDNKAAEQTRIFTADSMQINATVADVDTDALSDAQKGGFKA